MPGATFLMFCNTCSSSVTTSHLAKNAFDHQHLKVRRRRFEDDVAAPMVPSIPDVRTARRVYQHRHHFPTFRGVREVDFKKRLAQSVRLRRRVELSLLLPAGCRSRSQLDDHRLSHLATRCLLPRRDDTVYRVDRCNGPDGVTFLSQCTP